MGNKHAYLILAHHEFHMLRKLIYELDDKRNDIYILIDKKTKYVDEDMISSWAERARVFFVPRIKVFWGTLSVIEAELALLESAVKREYQYYHLLSGTNFPLKSQDEIHWFLEDKDCEYISLHSDDEKENPSLYGIKYFYPLLKYIGRGEFEGPGRKRAFMRWLVRQQSKLISCQERLGIDRTGKYKGMTFYKGEQWFSVTHDFACYILSQKKKIMKMFRLTSGGDHIVMPTLAMNSEYAERVEDCSKLTESEKFFAGKISFDRQPVLVNRISAQLHHTDETDKKPLISIVVPCYNVEDYLGDCVDSLIAQTYSNIEILLIDDGSTDATPAIAGKYAEQSDKVFYHHRINGGLSAARNTGISLARGEYIAFVDSDDWVDETYISCLYNTMQSAYADISVCGYIKEFEGDTKASESVSFDNDCVISSHSAMRILGDIYPKENVLLVIACNKLFKRSIFINNRFPEGRIHEDEFTAHRFIAEADSIAVTTADLYHYRIREGSITSGERKQDLRHLDYLEALQDRLERSGSMLYGDLLIYMLYTFFDGMKELMTLYTDDTIKERRLYLYFREKASRMYFKYFNDLDKYQKKDYLKLIIFPKKYRDTVIRLRKENSSE